MASLKNPAIAGDVQFDTFIYGAPPLAYPASLSQYVIYNTPDPAYVTGRVNISAFADLGSSTPWPFLNTNVPLNGNVCVPRGPGPFRSRFLRTGTIAHSRIPHPDTCTYASYSRRMGSSRQRLTRTFSMDLTSERTTAGRLFILNTSSSFGPGQHCDSSTTRQGRPEPHSHRGPFAWRGSRGACLTLQSACLSRRRPSGRIRRARSLSLRIDRRRCHRCNGSAICASLRANGCPGFVLRDPR